MKINSISIANKFNRKYPVFKNALAEHKSWGAVVRPDNEGVDFKLFTYTFSMKKYIRILRNKGEGVFETDLPVPSSVAYDGASYFYSLHKNDGTIDKVKDPYSYKQDKLLGESVIYDHKKYKWKDDKWFKDDKKRISRLANPQNGLTPLSALRIFEVNIATLSKRGDFEGAKEQFKKAFDMGFNAIEIMPVENTYSFNWGYDGVDKFAPSKYLGGPDKLKELIDYAHSIGLNVIMDMVPNHLGPDGASLLRTGPYIKGTNCFGESFNYEGQNSRYVKDFMVNAALNWLENYHCDGLRLDMTKMIESDKRVINPLYPFESGLGQDENTHINCIENIRNYNVPLSRLGFDSEWDFVFFHTLNSALYDNIDLDKLEQACYCSQDKVKFFTSHDEVGNSGGVRFIAQYLNPELNLYNNIYLNENDYKRAALRAKLKNTSEGESQNIIRSQKANFTAEKLAIAFIEGKFDKYLKDDFCDLESFKKEILYPLDIVQTSDITPQKFLSAFVKCFSKCKLGQALTYSLPGAKMIFQGDEKADITPFRFFREFESVKNEDYLYIEHGYQPGLPALMESKSGNIKYSDKAKKMMKGYSSLVKDLNELNAQNSALKNGYLNMMTTVKHPVSSVIALHCVEPSDGSEIYSISNFSSQSYGNENPMYGIKFPQGKWIEVINTDDKKYMGANLVNSTIQSDGYNNSMINLAGKSCAIFKRVE